MGWTFSPYQIPLLAAAFIALVLAVTVARRGARVASDLIVWLGCALALWSGANALEIGSTATEAKVFWANISYIGIVAVPVLWLLFASEYSGYGQPLSAGWLAALFVLPATTIALLWTSSHHRLIYQQLVVGAGGGLGLIVQARGPWFAVHTVYSYLLMLTGSALLVRVLMRSSRVYRTQAIALLTAALLPLLVNAIYLLAPRWELPIDLTPVSLTMSGVIVAIGLYRYGLLDIVPAARGAVVESMAEGLLVVDDRGNVADTNHAAEAILSCPAGHCLGRPAQDLLPEAAELMAAETEVSGEVELPATASALQRSYNVRVTPLYDGRGRLTSRLVVLRDVTARRQTEREREALLHEVERRVEQLRALAAELSQAEERERRRLAQVLHDHLQQLLVGARMHVAALRDAPGGTPPAPLIEELDALLQQSIAASRELTVELSPPALYEGTMAEALRWLAQWFGERHGLVVNTLLEEEAEPAGDDIRILLFQAARELLFNVVKHAGVRQAYLGMRLVNAHLIELVVADEGAGFEVAADRHGAIPPTGFGLLSVRERLQLAGGRMEVRSSSQQGTSITLYAPAYPIEAPTPVTPGELAVGAEAGTFAKPTTAKAVGAEAEESGEEEAPAIAGSPNEAVRVLLVDDHRTVREGLAALLRDEEGIRVVGQAINGPMAIELTGRLHPDVVVMDVTLPGMSGIEATRRIRARWPEVRVVGLSAHAHSDIAGAMRAAGAEAYLDKGGSAEALVAAIRDRPVARPRSPA